MPADDEVRARKRRSTRAVLSGLALMGVAALCSYHGLLPDPATTVAGVAGFLLMLYGVCLGWLVFYDRESDGPAV